MITHFYCNYQHHLQLRIYTIFKIMLQQKALMFKRRINKLYGGLPHSTDNDSSSTQNFYQTPNEVFSGSAALVRKTFCVSC